MSIEPTYDEMTPEERQRLRRQLTDAAVKLAVQSRWAEAVNANREFLKVFPNEPEALNRLAKALSELGRISEARKCYQQAIELEPTNTIAIRNLNRLAGLTDTAAAEAAPTQLDPKLFVEETGASTVAKLQATDAERAALLDAGDLVELQVQGNAVNVLTVNGDYVGMIEPRIGLRLSKLMGTGNQYAAAMMNSGGELRLMIRETFKSPENVNKVSFPQARSTAEVRGYMRRGLLRRDSDEVDYGDDDIEDAEETDGWSETSADGDDTTPDVGAEDDDEGFD